MNASADIRRLVEDDLDKMRDELADHADRDIAYEIYSKGLHEHPEWWKDTDNSEFEDEDSDEQDDPVEQAVTIMGLFLDNYQIPKELEDDIFDHIIGGIT